MKLGDISIVYLDIIQKAMAQHGFSIDDLLEKFAVSSDSLASPDAKISIPKFMRLGHACIEKSKVDWLGLTMGQVTLASDLGLAGLLALSSKNVASICQQLTTYQLLTSYNVRGESSFVISKGKNSELLVDDGQGILSFYSLKPYNEFNFFVVDLVLAGWYQIITDLSQQNDVIEKVCFEFSAPPYQQKYLDFFNCEVLFDQPNNYLVIKKEALALCCRSYCATTFELLKRYANAELDKVNRGLSFDEKVSRVIGALLDGSTPTLEQVAKQLNIPPWTVRRKLIEQGTSFQKTLNKAREELAINYVRDTDLTLGEIAYLVGFGSPAAFQRAFKRWTGAAPGNYREALSK